MTIRLVKNFDDYEHIKKLSAQGLVYLMKHSLTCPVSADARERFVKFCDLHEGLPCFVLNIQESKQVSDRVSRDTGIKHESPQVLLFKEGVVVWNESHRSIKKVTLESAMKNNI